MREQRTAVKATIADLYAKRSESPQSAVASTGRRNTLGHLY